MAFLVRALTTQRLVSFLCAGVLAVALVLLVAVRLVASGVLTPPAAEGVASYKVAVEGDGVSIEL